MSARPGPAAPAVEVQDAVRLFGEHRALDGVSLTVEPGRIHGLIGPNGAGKTTLLRAITGLLDLHEGRIVVCGIDTSHDPAGVRSSIGVVPSGDRTFYLRINGLENLSFFGRLQGLRRGPSLARARECLEAVGLTAAGSRWVGPYSHGMQKRLSVARALLISPPVLLVDEATHDLDPQASAQVRDLVRQAADDGAAVLWTTQRLDELRGFADAVTVIASGRRRFQGTVPELVSRSRVRSFVLRLSNPDVAPLLEPLRAAVAGLGALETDPDLGPAHLRLLLLEDARLGSALVALEQCGATVEGCTETRSTLEDAFLALTGPVEDVSR